MFFVDCEFLPLDLFGLVCERKDIRILKRHVDELNELFVSGAEAWAARKRKTFEHRSSSSWESSLKLRMQTLENRWELISSHFSLAFHG